jgi:hypothetical protein
VVVDGDFGTTREKVPALGPFRLFPEYEPVIVRSPVAEGENLTEQDPEDERRQ